MLQDKDLLKCICEKNQNALEALYTRYFERMTRFVTQITRDPQITLEVVNDVFLVVWKSAQNFRGDSTVSTWIMGIAYHKALKAVSRKPTWISLNDCDDIEEEKSASLSLEENIAHIMEKLSPEQRAVVELTYYAGYTYKEIGEILDCPENTVKSRMFSARKVIKRRMAARS